MSDFIKVKDGLRNCLLQFLDSERVFAYRSYRQEGVFDKITGEKTSLFKISGLKKIEIFRIQIHPLAFKVNHIFTEYIDTK